MADKNNSNVSKIVIILGLLGLGYFVKKQYDKKNIKTSSSTNNNGDFPPNNNNEPPPPPPPQLPSIPTMAGVLESEYTNNTFIGGWAANIDDVEKSTKVDIFIDGVKVATVDSNLDRQYVRDYINNSYFPDTLDVKNKNFGFYYKIPDANKQVGEHIVKVVFTNTKENLRNSPSTYTIMAAGNADVFYSDTGDNNPNTGHTGVGVVIPPPIHIIHSEDF